MCLYGCRSGWWRKSLADDSEMMPCKVRSPQNTSCAAGEECHGGGRVNAFHLGRSESSQPSGGPITMNRNYPIRATARLLPRSRCVPPAVRGYHQNGFLSASVITESWV